MKRLARTLRLGDMAATLAFVLSLLALAGAAWALGANTIGSGQIKRGAVKSSDIAVDAVNAAKVRNGTLRSVDFAGGLPRGAPGADGADGTELTPTQVLGLVTGADGAGSGLEAERLDGFEASSFARGYSFHHEGTAPAFPAPAATIATLPLGPGQAPLLISCGEGPGAAAVSIHYSPTSAAAADRELSVWAVSDGVDFWTADTADAAHMGNGTRLWTTSSSNARIIVADGTNGASSELQIVLRENGVVSVLNLHVFVQDNVAPPAGAFCEATGTVTTGPALP